MYICPSCGHLQHEEEFEGGTQVHGYTSLGDALAEEYVDFSCRHCGDDMVEATECKICGEYYYEEVCYPGGDRPKEGICKKCCTLENALEFGSENAKQVSLNGFIALMYTSAEIDDILLNYTLKNYVCNESDYYEYLEDIT